MLLILLIVGAFIWWLVDTAKSAPRPAPRDPNKPRKFITYDKATMTYYWHDYAASPEENRAALEKAIAERR